MKSSLYVLLSAGATALGLAGCASASRPASAADHTLEIRQSTQAGLSFPVDDGTGAIVARLSVSAPVNALDKAGVLEMLGRPAQRLTPDVWIYWHYCSFDQAAENGGHDTLVVAFEREKVLGMKLVDGDALRAHLAGRPPRGGVTRL